MLCGILFTFGFLVRLVSTYAVMLITTGACPMIQPYPEYYSDLHINNDSQIVILFVYRFRDQVRAQNAYSNPHVELHKRITPAFSTVRCPYTRLPHSVSHQKAQ
jgi:hypothetical protein